MNIIKRHLTLLFDTTFFLRPLINVWGIYYFRFLLFGLRTSVLWLFLIFLLRRLFQNLQIISCFGCIFVKISCSRIFHNFWIGRSCWLYSFWPHALRFLKFELTTQLSFNNKLNTIYLSKIWFQLSDTLLILFNCALLNLFRHLTLDIRYPIEVLFIFRKPSKIQIEQSNFKCDNCPGTVSSYFINKIQDYILNTIGVLIGTEKLSKFIQADNWEIIFKYNFFFNTLNKVLLQNLYRE